MKKILLLSLLLLSTNIVISQDFNIRGFLYDQENGEPVIFEKVLLLKKDSTILTGGNTDINGFFSFPKIDIG